MPRRKPLPNKPSTPRKQSTEFVYEKNFEYSCSIPCANPRCGGFMFLIMAKYGIHAPVIDELECFVCKRVRKLGPHNPRRPKPVPLTRKGCDPKRRRS